MTFHVVTLFPDIAAGYFQGSIMARAVERGLVRVNLVNIRDFAVDRHRTVDDAPYGGGAGMVLMAEPLSRAIESVQTPGSRVLFPTPSGKPFNTDYARRLASEQELVIICGRYEGVDQRVIDRFVDDEICIGDYVLSSGEVAALVVVDAVYRLLSGVINEDSLTEESFSDGLVEYPHYTRPEEFEGKRVPSVLLSGHHERIREWRLRKRLGKTRQNRPDLISRLSPDYRTLLDHLDDIQEE